jgi:DNA-binding CsgD family transcriptional regulator
MASGNGHHAGGAAKGAELSKIEQRRREVASLMMAHFTYREMAERLGVAPSTISDDVKVIRKRWRERAVADYASHLAEELAKLDLLEHELLPIALSGGPKGRVNFKAVDRVLAIRDRRARMIGLDAPSKVETTFKVESIVRALEDTLAELGIDDRQVRPVLGRRLRELGGDQ